MEENFYILEAVDMASSSIEAALLKYSLEAFKTNSSATSGAACCKYFLAKFKCKVG